MRIAAVLRAPLVAARPAPGSLRRNAAAAPPAARTLRRGPRGFVAVRAFQQSSDKSPVATAVAVTFSLKHKVRAAAASSRDIRRRLNMCQVGWAVVAVSVGVQRQYERQLPMHDDCSSFDQTGSCSSAAAASTARAPTAVPNHPVTHPLASR